MTVSRRQFLVRSGLIGASGAAAAGALGPAGAALGPGLAAGATAGADELLADGTPQRAITGGPAARLPAVPFGGPHQAGILGAPPPAACFAACDVTAGDVNGLADLLRAITDTARFLTAGGRPDPGAPGAPPADSGTLGPVVPADGLTVTLGVGPALFDHRFGLRARKPAGLFAMRAFPNDELDPAQCGGDLMLSICAGASDTALHALRELTRAGRGAMRIRWRVDGFAAPPRPAGVPRNHMGFRDGIANPRIADPEVAHRLLWTGPGAGAHAWTGGGTYHVIRVIRMFTEAWDELALGEQERIVGRHRDSGAPLGARHEDDAPRYAADPDGHVIPLGAHIRLANPRTARTAASRILRRSYNYDRGLDERGRLDLGLVFNCYQRDIRRQFETVQDRLAHEPMAPFIRPVGGGYFFTLPGVRDHADWLGKSLLGA